MRLIIALSCAVAGALISAVLSILYSLNRRRKRRIEKEYESKFTLLEKELPYIKYKEIATQTSVANKPIRSNGDFMDFLLTKVDPDNCSHLENRLYKFECGGQR